MINRYTRSLTMIFLFFWTQTVLAQTKVDTLEEEYSIEWLKENGSCNDLDSTVDCQIRQYGFMDSIDGHKYYYAQYLYERNEDNPDYDSLNESSIFYGQGVAIFESIDDTLVRPIWYHFSENPEFIEEPLIQMTSYGCIFHPNISTGGNRGLGEDDRYFIRRSDHWFELKNPDYYDIFLHKIPNGYYMDSASPINLNEMTYSIAIYKPGDAGCCPTGGDITAYLKIQQYDIVVVKVIYNENGGDK